MIYCEKKNCKVCAPEIDVSHNYSLKLSFPILIKLLKQCYTLITEIVQMAICHI